LSAELVRAALGYARRGLPVLPLWWTDDLSDRCACGAAPGECKPGKHPLGDLVHHGVKDATVDQRTIANWWRRYPPANIGIACGRDFRLLVDVDPDGGGNDSLADLEREHGALPATIEAATPRGGRHLYLIVPNGRPLPTISAGKLGPGIDHRCQGGYVAAPPSAIFGKPYTWATHSGARFAAAPDWLLERLGHSANGDGTATPPEEWLELVTAGVDEGARNHAIARIAGLLFRRLPEPALAAELVACWNLTKCRPPLEAHELKRTIDSIAAKEMRRRGLQP
jgi:Bifunctional DNA primase/polymerase, N-terminal/Primase C terminal 1 (PriCT-1)